MDVIAKPFFGRGGTGIQSKASAMSKAMVKLKSEKDAVRQTKEDARARSRVKAYEDALAKGEAACEASEEAITRLRQIKEDACARSRLQAYEDALAMADAACEAKEEVLTRLREDACARSRLKAYEDALAKGDAACEAKEEAITRTKWKLDGVHAALALMRTTEWKEKYVHLRRRETASTAEQS